MARTGGVHEHIEPQRDCGAPREEATNQARGSGGRLAAATAWPWRFWVSSGVVRWSRWARSGNVGGQHLPSLLEDHGAAVARGHSPENKNMFDIVEISVMRKGVAEVNTDGLENGRALLDRPGS